MTKKRESGIFCASCKGLRVECEHGVEYPLVTCPKDNDAVTGLVALSGALKARCANHPDEHLWHAKMIRRQKNAAPPQPNILSDKNTEAEQQQKPKTSRVVITLSDEVRALRLRASLKRLFPEYQIEVE